jgi:hypothetical protein
MNKQTWYLKELEKNEQKKNKFGRCKEKTKIRI